MSLNSKLSCFLRSELFRITSNCTFRIQLEIYKILQPGFYCLDLLMLKVFIIFYFFDQSKLQRITIKITAAQKMFSR